MESVHISRKQYNINEDSTIPQFEEPAWQTHNSWIAQVVGYGPDCQSCDSLEKTITDAEVDNQGVRSSLLVKAEQACRALERSQPVTAGNILCALLNEVDAQDGKHVSNASAEAIRSCVKSFALANGIPLEPCNI